MNVLLDPHPATALCAWIALTVIAMFAGLLGAPEPTSGDDRAGASLVRCGIWVGLTGVALVRVGLELEPAFATMAMLLLPVVGVGLAIVALASRDRRRAARMTAASIRRRLWLVGPVAVLAAAGLWQLSVSATAMARDPEAGVLDSVGFTIAPLGLACTAASLDVLLRLSSEQRATRFGLGAVIELATVVGVIVWVVLRPPVDLMWPTVAILAGVGLAGLADYALIHPTRRTNSATAGYAAAIMVAIAWIGLVFAIIVAVAVWIRLAVVPRKRRTPLGPAFGRAVAAPMACTLIIAFLRFDAFLLR